jgi:hypothetical protein
MEQDNPPLLVLFKFNWILILLEEDYFNLILRSHHLIYHEQKLKIKIFGGVLFGFKMHTSVKILILMCSYNYAFPLRNVSSYHTPKCVMFCYSPVCQMVPGWRLCCGTKYFDNSFSYSTFSHLKNKT